MVLILQSTIFFVYRLTVVTVTRIEESQAIVISQMIANFFMKVNFKSNNIFLI